MDKARQLFFSSHDELFSKAFSVFKTSVESLKSEVVTIALPGGRSIAGMLSSLLSNANQLSRRDWQRLHFFMLDERLVELTHTDSNYRMLRESFFDKAITADLLRAEQVHPFSPDFEREDFGVAAYKTQLDIYGGLFQIVFLGAGEDGHVAALFPEHDALWSAAPGFVTFENSPKPPSGRMSSSRGLIQGADTAISFLLGESKRAALELYLSGQETLEKCPLKMVDSVQNSFLFTDLSIAN